MTYSKNYKKVFEAINRNKPYVYIEDIFKNDEGKWAVYVEIGFKGIDNLSHDMLFHHSTEQAFSAWLLIRSGIKKFRNGSIK